MDTSVPTHPHREPDVEATEPRSLRRWFTGWSLVGGIAAVLVVALVAAAVVRIPYYRISPGRLRPVDQAIQIEGTPTYPSDGTIEYPTISMGQVTPLQAFVGWLDPDVDVLHEDDALGGQDREQNRQLNLAAMTASTQVASTVALRTLGYEVTSTGTGAVVMSVVEGSAADGVVEVGDTVVAVDGTPVGIAEELGELLGAKAPGDEAVLRLESFHDGAGREVTVTLGAHPDEPDRAMLGVTSSTRDIRFHFPFEVTVQTGEVGGPSAGLAFTLGVVDLLTPGDLTGGNVVASTGTIRLDGSVGPIGGIHQKVVAADDAGATIFFVPVQELDQAEAAAAGMSMEVVGVASLDDAIAALEDRGGVLHG